MAKKESTRKNLFDKISTLTEVNTNTDKSLKKGRKVDLKTLHFEINEDTEKKQDGELSVFVKKLINENNVTNKDVYDTFGRAEGWNMIYGLSKGSISWERVKKWCELIGYKIEIQLIPIDEK